MLWLLLPLSAATVTLAATATVTCAGKKKELPRTVNLADDPSEGDTSMMSKRVQPESSEPASSPLSLKPGKKKAKASQEDLEKEWKEAETISLGSGNKKEPPKKTEAPPPKKDTKDNKKPEPPKGKPQPPSSDSDSEPAPPLIIDKPEAKPIVDDGLYETIGGVEESKKKARTTVVIDQRRVSRREIEGGAPRGRTPMGKPSPQGTPIGQPVDKSTPHAAKRLQTPATQQAPDKYRLENCSDMHMMEVTAVTARTNVSLLVSHVDPVAAAPSPVPRAMKCAPMASIPANAPAPALAPAQIPALAPAFGTPVVAPSPVPRAMKCAPMAPLPANAPAPVLAPAQIPALAPTHGTPVVAPSPVPRAMKCAPMAPLPANAPVPALAPALGTPVARPAPSPGGCKVNNDHTQADSPPQAQVRAHI